MQDWIEAKGPSHRMLRHMLDVHFESISEPEYGKQSYFSITFKHEVIYTKKRKLHCCTAVKLNTIWCAAMQSETEHDVMYSNATDDLWCLYTRTIYIYITNTCPNTWIRIGSTITGCFYTLVIYERAKCKRYNIYLWRCLTGAPTELYVEMASEIAPPPATLATCEYTSITKVAWWLITSKQQITTDSAWQQITTDRKQFWQRNDATWLKTQWMTGPPAKTAVLISRLRLGPAVQVAGTPGRLGREPLPCGRLVLGPGLLSSLLSSLLPCPLPCLLPCLLPSLPSSSLSSTPDNTWNLGWQPKWQQVHQVMFDNEYEAMSFIHSLIHGFLMKLPIWASSEINESKVIKA